MKLGLANGNVPRTAAGFTDEVLDQWQSESIQFLAVNFGQTRPSLKEAKELRIRLADRGIQIAQFAGVNANFTHYDESVRADAHQRVIDAIPLAKELGALCISSGGGTNRDIWQEHFYAPDPRNHTAEARERLAAGLRGIAPLIEDSGIDYAVEGHQLTAMSTPHLIRSVLDAVDSPAIVATFDPVNLLDSAASVLNNGTRIQEVADVVGGRFGRWCHLKDVILRDELVCHIDEVDPGTGVLDFHAYFNAVRQLRQPAVVIVEHMSAETWLKGIRYVKERASEEGIDFR